VSSAGHSAAASSATDTVKLIEGAYSLKHAYPDGWDSLMGSNGNALWTASAPPSTQGLHRELSGATNPKLTAGTLTADYVTALNNAGIFTLYNLSTSTSETKRPGDMFNTPTSISSGSSVAFVSASGGQAIVDHIYRDNKLSTGTPGLMPTGKVLVVFGLGPNNNLVQGHTNSLKNFSMLEAPTYSNVDATITYNRLLAVFEIDTTGSTPKATFKTMLGTDGDLIDDMEATINN
jgi:hypothetical protein